MADKSSLVSKVEKMKTMYSGDKPKKKKIKDNAVVDTSSKLVNETDEELLDNFSDATASTNSKWHSKSLYAPDTEPLNYIDDGFSVHSDHNEVKKTHKKSTKPKKLRQIDTEFLEQAQPSPQQSKLRAKINSASSMRAPSREVKLPFSLRDTPLGKYRMAS